MTEQALRNQSPAAPPSGLALFEQVNATLKASEEAKRHLSAQLQKYGAAFAKLKQAYDKLAAAHEIQTNELTELKAAKVTLTETVRHQSSMLQSYESQFQMFSAEVVRSDAQLLDCDSLVSPVFDLDAVNNGQQSPVLSFDLEQTINAYATDAAPESTPSVMTVFPTLSVPEEVASTFENEGEALITDADFNLDMEAIARDIECETEKAA
ncbi:hypothetical protein [Rhizobium sp. MHM7A]|uniref:hypothetical protein n=1 Tax=Rhizobium sp. MHM7A TaxID=2583233 RepID=UPI0011069CFF|nr:hypothetical protein [Rhizobium sp. MHM7A]TLX17220.1 hypothetical protein FFR93_07955 [Rhizobium sp. MHM7A]